MLVEKYGTKLYKLFYCILIWVLKIISGYNTGNNTGRTKDNSFSQADGRKSLYRIQKMILEVEEFSNTIEKTPKQYPKSILQCVEGFSIGKDFLIENYTMQLIKLNGYHILK